MRLDWAALYIGRDGRGMLLSTKGALHVSFDCNDATWTGHLELQIGVVWDRVEAGESSSSEQCVIAAMEGDDVEDQVFASEVIRGTEHYLQRY